MTHSQKGIARCPRCDRTITTEGARYKTHSAIAGKPGTTCRMTDQRVPITGDSGADYLSRAYHVADLADQVQDRDPSVVWDYLTATPAGELQRLLIIALAAFPVDKPIDEIFGWVTQLPAAKEATA